MDNNVEPFLLWLPANLEMPDEESNDLIQKVTLANDAILNFAEGIITLDDTFQRIEYYGANIDDYQNIIDQNLRKFGA